MCCHLLYHLREYVTKDTLKMIYYRYAYSRIQYGITIWGTATQKHLHELEVCLNNLFELWRGAKKFLTLLLKLNDIYKLELAKFMHQLFNHKLPQPFESLFTQIERIHSHGIKQQYKQKYFFQGLTKQQVKKDTLIDGWNFGMSLAKN